MERGTEIQGEGPPSRRERERLAAGRASASLPGCGAAKAAMPLLALFLLGCGPEAAPKPGAPFFPARRKAMGAPEAVAILDDLAAAVRERMAAKGLSAPDAAREFVHENSLHEIDADHDAYAWDGVAVARRLRACHRDAKPPPHLSCGPRAEALAAILRRMGYRCRLAHLFSDDFASVRSHTLVDVLIPESGLWEAQDPDANAVYLPAAPVGGGAPTPRRLSASAMAMAPPPGVSPAGPGADSEPARRVARHYCEAAMLEREDGRVPPESIVVNAARFSIAKRFEGNGGVTFPEFVARNYGAVPLAVEGLEGRP